MRDASPLADRWLWVSTGALWSCLTWVAFSGTAFSQELEPPKPVLPREAQEALGKASGITAYRVKFTLEVKEEEGKPLRLTGELSFKRPNRRRLTIWQGDSKEVAQLLVCDGKVEWQYFPDTHVVYRTTHPLDAPGPHRPFSEVKAESLRFVQRQVTQAGSEGQEAPEALLYFEGVPIPAVVEGSPVPIKSLSVGIAEEDGLVRQLSLLDEKGQVILTQRYYDFELNPTFPEGEFVYAPSVEVAVIDLDQPGGAPPAPAPVAPAEQKAPAEGGP